jgi:hypothetical protein
MTNELEKQFFQCFGIEPIACNDCIECYEANTTPFPWCEKLDYPQITDRILLELICILLSNNSPYMFKLGDWNVEKLKETVLTTCIKLPDFLEWEDTSDYFKHQVRTLFEEG